MPPALRSVASAALSRSSSSSSARHSASRSLARPLAPALRACRPSPARHPHGCPPRRPRCSPPPFAGFPVRPRASHTLRHRYHRFLRVSQGSPLSPGARVPRMHAVSPRGAERSPALPPASRRSTGLPQLPPLTPRCISPPSRGLIGALLSPRGIQGRSARCSVSLLSASPSLSRVYTPCSADSARHHAVPPGCPGVPRVPGARAPGRRCLSLSVVPVFPVLQRSRSPFPCRCSASGFPFTMRFPASPFLGFPVSRFPNPRCPPFGPPLGSLCAQPCLRLLLPAEGMAVSNSSPTAPISVTTSVR